MLRGDRVRVLREDRGLTQKDMAMKLGIGVATLQRIERDEADTTSTIIEELTKFLGVSADYLMGLTDSPRASVPSDLNDTERAMVAALRKNDMKAIIRLVAERV